MSSFSATPVALIERASSRPSDLLRATTVLLMAVAQVAASVYVTQTGQDGFTEPFPGGDPPIVPATYAFAVWGPIYLGMLVFAVYHALPSQRGRPVMRATGWWAATACAATASWLLVAMDSSRIWVTVAILALIASALITALRNVQANDPEPLSRADRFVMVAPLSVFAGWATVATAANIAAALRETEVTVPGAGERAISLALLLAATAVAGLVLRSLRGSVWYAMTVLWAVLAIAVANLSGETRPLNPTMAFAASVASIAVVIVLVREKRRARTALAGALAGGIDAGTRRQRRFRVSTDASSR